MGEYPEHQKMAGIAGQTQAIGEFLEWLEGQGVQLMTWHEDLTDSRPTDPECKARRRENRADPCRPTSASDIGGADYFATHCLHWHGKSRDAGDNIQEQGMCCWCGKGHYYEVAGLKAFVHEARGTMQLLADWAGIDLAKIEAEKRQMLEDIRAANEAVTRG